MTNPVRIRRISPWLAASVVVSLVVVVPVGVVVASVFRDSHGAWAHLVETRLADYAVNTLILAVAVGALALALGVPTAWVVTMYRFPASRVLAWGLMLPLAMPAYVAAYALTDMFQFSGPVQTWLRHATGLEAGAYWFPEVRSMSGAIIVLGFALYPYVYFAARTAFLGQSRSAFEASRTLGRGPTRTFVTLAIPQARPYLVAAAMLVLMETVSDFGAVDYCAVDTFATGIYRTWFGLDSQNAAAQLSSVLLVCVCVLIAVERGSRRHKVFHHTTARCSASPVARLGPAAGLATSVACCMPIVIGFVLPASRLAYLAWQHGDQRAFELFADHAARTFLLAAVSGVGAVALAVVVVYAWRLHRGTVARLIVDVCRSGYALPGPIVAIGVVVALGWVDHRVHGFATWASDGAVTPGLIFTGSALALLIGYQTRFLAIALAFVEGGFARVHRHLDDAARTLGAKPARVLVRLHVPALRSSLIAAGLLVFVDVVKELPATLMLRPFNFDTLAVRVYQLATDERLHEASTGALAIVAVGILPVAILSRQVESSRLRVAEVPA